MEMELVQFYQSESMAKVRLQGLKTLNGGRGQKARTDILWEFGHGREQQEDRSCSFVMPNVANSHMEFLCT